MYVKIIFLLLSSLFSLGVLAQGNLAGVVTDSVSDKPVSDVYIMLMSEDGKSILSYSFTQANGTFTIEYPKTEQQIFLLTTS